MVEKESKRKLLERTVGPVNEKMLDYMIENFDAVTFMSAEKLCYAMGCTEEELREFWTGFGVESLLELMMLLRQVIYGEEGPAD